MLHCFDLASVSNQFVGLSFPTRFKWQYSQKPLSHVGALNYLLVGVCVVWWYWCSFLTFTWVGTQYFHPWFVTETGLGFFSWKVALSVLKHLAFWGYLLTQYVHTCSPLKGRLLWCDRGNIWTWTICLTTPLQLSLSVGTLQHDFFFSNVSLAQTICSN